MEKPLGGKIEKLLANQVAVLCCLPLRISQPLDLMLHLVYYLLLTMNRNTRTHGHLGWRTHGNSLEETEDCGL